MKYFSSPIGKSIQDTIKDAGPLLLATLTVFFLNFSLLAQGNLGRILGTITDQSGGVVAGAMVTVLDQERGTTRTLTTDQAGEYNAPNLTPGTIVNPGGNERQSTNGLRGTDNVYLVDGLANDEIYTGLSMLNAPTFAGDVGVILPVDSIQEFNTSANNKAELGLKPGGVVSVGIKSGTNTISGSAFAFGRSTGFNAKNFLNTPAND